ncbi:hypothetical protein O6H91_21G003400 [Diphasiastrum complanatum]|uniref:Uncharacterized protein n=1 Tax=Diphasiastrum complanatum TaxID=34168 RepID=A0ACC2AHE4_DIPCM|nr:hypothetical protein O6H91_21G003400 [Diphasiastrum complanatum]
MAEGVSGSNRLSFAKPALQHFAKRSCRCGYVRSFSAHANPSHAVRRYAVLGAGFAGLSVAWHLLQHTNAKAPVCVDLFDEEGIGAGASGVSGGRLLWKGAEGWSAAVQLFSVAERAIALDSSITDLTNTQLPIAEPLVWRRGIIRPAFTDNEIQEYKQNMMKHSGIPVELTTISGAQAKMLVPGLTVMANDVVFFMPQAVNINPRRYLQALWHACQTYARDASARGCAETKVVLIREHVQCLSGLPGDYDGVVVCLGAKVNLLPELAGKLPLSSCRGIVANLHLPLESGEELREDMPSILSNTWLAIQGTRRLVLGATRVRGSTELSSVISQNEASRALEELISKTAMIYPPILTWKVTSLSAGVRAIPPRTNVGALPLVGCIDEIVENYLRRNSCAEKNRPHFWLFGGLGSRGLIYHAWLGKKIAEAVVSKDEAILPQELKQWKYRTSVV